MAVVFSYIPDILLVLRAPGYFVIATSGLCVLLYLFLFRDVSKEVGIGTCSLLLLSIEMLITS